MKAPKFGHQLMIVLRPLSRPRIFPFEQNNVETFELDTERFVRSPCNDFELFYDWLRSDLNSIVGVKLCDVDRESNIPTNLLMEMNGVKVVPDANNDECDILIFWDEHKIFDEELSADQMFGGNRIFLGSNSSWAMTFCSPGDGKFGLHH